MKRTKKETEAYYQGFKEGMIWAMVLVTLSFIGSVILKVLGIW